MDRHAIQAAVHKHHPNHVWITAIEHVSADTLRAEFRLPMWRGGPRFSEFVEVQRQAGLIHAHDVLRVPLGEVFVLNSIQLSVSGRAETPSSEVRGIVMVTAARSSSERIRSAKQEYAISGPHDLIGAGVSNASFVSPKVYVRLRGNGHPPARVSPPDPRASTSNLLLDPPEGDPLLADHESDHISGMSIVSGIERALSDRDGRRIGSMSLTFTGYAEQPGSPLVFRLEQEDPFGFRGTVTQSDAIVATAAGEFSTEVTR